MATGMFSGGAAFGVFPQMQPRRRFQDPVGAANVPLDVTRGRFAGLAGLLPDTLNFMGRSPMPTEMFGETQYEPTQQLPYGSEYYLQNLPLKPTSRIGEVAGQAGAFVPLNPMPAARAVAAGARALGPTAVGMGERYLQSRGLMPGVVEGGAIPGSYEGFSVLMNPKNLTPLNKIEDANKYKSILNSMQEFGYQGRPILAYMDKGQAKALTGSHRLYAARNAGIDVPVVFVKPSVMKWEDKEGLFGTFKESINDQRVYQHLKAAGDDTAASLAKLEDQIYQPAGMLGGPIKPQAPVSPIGFYSATEQAALNLPRKSGTGDSFLNDLMKGQDVKKDELSWIGLDDYLKGKPNVTRQEVQDFISNNRVDVQERQLSGRGEKFGVFSEFNPDKNQFMVYGEDLSHTHAFNTAEEADNFVKQFNSQIPYGPSKYDSYQLPGGENYREILLTLPEKAPAMYPNFETYFKAKYSDYADSSNPAYAMAQRDAKRNWDATGGKIAIDDFSGNRVGLSTGNYTSSHFNEPNILAHMRVNDRVDADGKKMLLIEEIQSDWHQAGREKGYKTKESLEKWYNQNKLDDDPSFADLNSEQRSVIERNRSAGMNGDNAVPDAPFKDTWHQLALKRALKYAADNGYDRVGLTTGRQQAERYQLSKQISEVHYSGTNFKAYDLDGKAVIFRTGVKPEDLAGLIGKEPAKKLLEQPKQGTLQSLTGQNLDVGGEGMKKYYDEIYPAFLAKQGKKYNAKTGETKIRTSKNLQDEDFVSGQLRISEALGDYGQRGYKTTDNRFFDTYADAVSHEKKISSKDLFDAPIRYIDISPEMRGGVKKGQPLFTAAPIGGIGLGAGTQDNEMPDAVRQYMADPRYSDPFADTTR